ncbi:hypothetical protein TTHERM_01119430 (macronuclear) [Tetrahymena thermophila SB210]|uniref:Uncharacterized protein n=1 Tax=Tetrahymena thermophila (strain SB210) TaxID=312017 RepID=Q239N6_TETTS|nr:hypothetical protein TTHERM_01119430 [Tetrahymena thermophila SB210]EAR93234.2 hypothetical protein TTHERM_01119430 [Tetrahymena thermophila SB210]|eukprot:XP_001013479.2 hypothetical protein TTHERM_01119430 [Tetrahymena thermophila SB210]
MIISTSKTLDRNQIFNYLRLNKKDYANVKKQIEEHKSCQFILRSLSGKNNIISQFIVMLSDEDSSSYVELNPFTYHDEQEKYTEVEIIKKTLEVSEVVKINISFVSDSLNLVFLPSVLDVEEILKRQLIRQNQIFCTNTILNVKILENLIAFKIDSISYQDAYIHNQMFLCTNMSLFDIQIDYSSLLRFNKFYKTPKSTYLHEIINLNLDQEAQSQVQKFNQWLIYSSTHNDKSTDYQFLDKNRAVISFKSNGTQQQETKFQILKYLIKQQISLFNKQNAELNDSRQEESQKLYKIRYLNLREISQISQLNRIQEFFNQLSSCIKKQQNSYQTLLLIDSCEYFLEQDKYNENINKFNHFLEFIQNQQAVLFALQQESKNYYSLPEKITIIKL